ncbi:hypothetical protein JSQ81_06275 [Sporosarcina sp. Marseille-Q4063]|nr:hypothetical protein [Sporosarcina sp. Marseille-Q4063]QUW23166.1 hypothetical protein JSQ81_06275 [Sporosarcina sp. Marseille-Q4063]
MEFIALAFAAAALAFSSDIMNKNKKLTERIEALEEKMGIRKLPNNED